MSDEHKEIWVHVSAPVTLQNDKRFRSLADAYLHFKPCVEPGGTSPDGPPSSDQGHISPHLTTSKDSYGSFPSHIDSGSHSSSQGRANVQVASSLDEESQLHVSRLARLERIQAKWRQTTSRTSSAKAPPSSAFSEDAIIDDTQLAYQALESQIPDNVSVTSEDTSEEGSPPAVCGPLAKSTGNFQVTRSSMESKVLPSSVSDQAIPTISPVTNSEPASESPVPLVQCQKSVQSPSPVQCQKSVQSRKSVQSQNSVQSQKSVRQDFGLHPLEVYPPAPPVTVLSPRHLPTQVTRYLRTLKEENLDRFRPRKTVRALDQDERGCWVVETGLWPPTLQSKFWMTLADEVKNGRLGWGITLQREPANSSGLGPVRLYCWGEVVEHVWLALWLCSDGKISASGAKWVDAEEKTVILMQNGS